MQIHRWLLGRLRPCRLRPCRLRPWVGVLALGLVGTEAAADGMRCGTRLVSSGDSTYAVRSRCGDPQDATRRVETRTERRRVRVPCGRNGEAQCDRVQEVSAD